LLVGAQCAPYNALLLGLPQLAVRRGRVDKAMFI
jgi:hypothetical protein